MRIVALHFAVPAAMLACSSDALIWIPESSQADAIYRFVKDGKAGYIDKQGRVMIPASLRTFGNYGEAFFEGSRSYLSGVIDTTGKAVFEAKFDWVTRFSEGLMLGRLNDASSAGYFDKSGRVRIDRGFPPDTRFSSFSDGLAGFESQGRTGYMDHTGRVVIRPQFARGTSFEEGFARVVMRGPCYYTFYDSIDPCTRIDPTWVPYEATKAEQSGAGRCEWTVINKAGDAAFPRSLDAMLPYHEGLAVAQDRGLWGFIDIAGRFAIPARFAGAESFSEGLAFVEDGSGNRMFINKQGQPAFALPKGAHAERFESGLTPVCVNRDGPCHYANSEGQVRIPGPFLRASRFHRGIAHVKRPDGEFAYLDTSGRKIFSYRP